MLRSGFFADNRLSPRNRDYWLPRAIKEPAWQDSPLRCPLQDLAHRTQYRRPAERLC
jgi:hypothetical protein